MNDMQQIDRALRVVEAKVSRLKNAARERQTRIRAKIARLQRFASSSEATDRQRLEIRKALTTLQAKVESKNIMPSLDEVEKEVDRIYGDQSKNETYYFSRRNLKSGSRDPKVAAFLRQGEKMEIPWSTMSYEQVQDAVDSIYGNQSDNATYYFSKGKQAVRMLEAALSGRSAMTLQEVMQQMDELYGDQSKNETFYPSRRHDDADRLDMVSIAGDDLEGDDLAGDQGLNSLQDEESKRDGNWQTDEQHYLLTDDFDDSKHQRMSGYEIPGYFAEDNFSQHNTVDPSYRVDPTVDTFGYWGDDADEMPHVIKNRTAALSKSDRMVVEAFLDHRPLDGKMLTTDGVRLEKMGMGSRVMAEWVRGKVEVTDEVHVKSDESILRMLKKLTPARMLLEPVMI